MRLIDADVLKHELFIRQHLLNADSLWKTLEIMDAQPTADVVERKKGEWTTHEVACLLAEVIGDNCACNVNGNDEWLPFVCEFAETTCPDVVGVTCWEQWLVHRKEKTDGLN